MFFYIIYSISYKKLKFLSCERSMIIKLKLKEINKRIL